MKKKIKLVFIIIGIIGAIIIGLLIMAAILGKEVTVKPDKQLEGVDEEVENILYYASLAPNSHNAQMWGIELHPKDGELYVGIDETRVLDVVDSSKREAYISLGCYMANLQTAFEAYGYDIKLDIYDKPDENGFISKVTYAKAREKINYATLKAIEKRHTDKGAYKDTRIAPEIAETITLDNSICYLDGSDNFEYLKKGTLDAIMVQSANQAYRDELAEWMRFSDSEVLKKQDGISAEQMGLKGIVKSFYYWTTDHESAKGDTFANQGINTAKKQLEGCKGILAVTGDNTIKGWINAGLDTEEIWLKCVEQGISVQPMSAMLETEPFAQSIQKDLGTDKPVQMILRIGYADEYGKNSDIRRNLNEYITVVE
ncbi:MAG: hypothetical protein AB9836_11575 [Aminipila sp.]